MKLEAVVIPVSDVDGAKEFYGRLGWRLDADRTGDDFRLIQFTPPGSGCSVQFGTNITSVVPGSAQDLHLIVSDIEGRARRAGRRGVEVSEVFHCSTGFTCCRYRDAGTDRSVNVPAPDRTSYGSFASFSDPDGNAWLFQEVTTRFPGRVGDTWAPTTPSPCRPLKVWWRPGRSTTSLREASAVPVVLAAGRAAERRRPRERSRPGCKPITRPKP
jgi:catechol 2,3-dioxygenase-like lactoylglutathione lyase family enzyme